jgi:hypothetical protein
LPIELLQRQDSASVTQFGYGKPPSANQTSRTIRSGCVGTRDRTRRKGEPITVKLNRDWPHHIALPAEKVCGPANSDAVRRFTGTLSAALLTYLVRRADAPTFVVFCFKTDQGAQVFAERFGGEFFRPSIRYPGRRIAPGGEDSSSLLELLPTDYAPRCHQLLQCPLKKGPGETGERPVQKKFIGGP